MSRRTNLILVATWFAFLLAIFCEAYIASKMGSITHSMLVIFRLCVVGMVVLFPFSIVSCMLSLGAGLFLKDGIVSNRLAKSPIYFLLWREIRLQLTKRQNVN